MQGVKAVQGRRKYAAAAMTVASASQWPNDATTAMIRNIPNRYTAEEVLAELLSTGFRGTFDFFYLPMDFVTKKNRGYGFVNFHFSETAACFVRTFHGRRLPLYATEKSLEVVPALQQGYEANVVQHARRETRVLNPWFRPMVFGQPAAAKCPEASETAKR